VSPLQGAILLSNKEFLVRWQITPLAPFTPDSFNLELLNANAEPIPNFPLIANRSRDFFVDPAYGANGTVWKVPGNATNGRYRLKWTANFANEIVTNDPPTAISEVFTVGPEFVNLTRSNSGVKVVMAGGIGGGGSWMVMVMTMIWSAAVLVGW
jgi:hypothetical protein